MREICSLWAISTIEFNKTNFKKCGDIAGEISMNFKANSLIEDMLKIYEQHKNIVMEAYSEISPKKATSEKVTPTMHPSFQWLRTMALCQVLYTSEKLTPKIASAFLHRGKFLECKERLAIALDEIKKSNHPFWEAQVHLGLCSFRRFNMGEFL